MIKKLTNKSTQIAALFLAVLLLATIMVACGKKKEENLSIELPAEYRVEVGEYLNFNSNSSGNMSYSKWDGGLIIVETSDKDIVSVPYVGSTKLKGEKLGEATVSINYFVGGKNYKQTTKIKVVEHGQAKSKAWDNYSNGKKSFSYESLAKQLFEQVEPSSSDVERLQTMLDDAKANTESVRNYTKEYLNDNRDDLYPAEVFALENNR